MRDEAPVPGESPAEAFALLGEETRLDIIRALGETGGDDRMPRLSFSALRERVDVRNSSRFNYHLNELLGRYVEEDDEGYVLTYPGLLAWLALKKGVYADPGAVSRGPFDLGAACPTCEGTLAARYRDGGFEVRCPDCGTRLFRRPLPPATARRADREALLDAAGRTYLQEVALRREGFCPVCARAVAPELLSGDAPRAVRDDRLLRVVVGHVCDHCDVFSFNTVGEYVLSHPTVRAFLREHGEDPGRVWDHAFAVADDHTQVRSRDPWSVAVTVAADGDDRVAVVDGSLSVTFE